jgi:ADP-ribose pyrophosphatase YjhB (NUDIX family)
MSIFSKVIYQAGKIVWRITKPVTAGTRVILIRDNKILLVKHTYQEHWYLPGGGIKKGETFEQAIRREIEEELDGQMGSLKLFGVYNNFFENKNDHVVIFICDEFSIAGKKDREIENFDFFDTTDLPKNTAPGTRRRIEEFINGRVVNFGRW